MKNNKNKARKRNFYDTKKKNQQVFSQVTGYLVILHPCCSTQAELRELML